MNDRTPRATYTTSTIAMIDCTPTAQGRSRSLPDNRSGRLVKPPTDPIMPITATSTAICMAIMRRLSWAPTTPSTARTRPSTAGIKAVKLAAANQLKGILGWTDAPNVSIDFNHDPHSSTFHMDQTKVMDGTLVRVMSWYDNEWGFSNRMADTAVAMGKLG